MTLQDMLVEEIKDIYHAEKQLTKALPKLAKAATHEDLRDAFRSHLEETQEQISRLEEVFGALGEKVKAKPCAGMAGIIEEGNDTMKEDAEGAVMDAALIAAAQRAEHYEITAYGTCVEWARLLGLDEVAGLLEQTLEEEKAADKKLTAIAEQHINQAALAEGQPEDDEDEDDDSDEPVSAGAGRSAGRSTSGAGRGSAGAGRGSSSRGQASSGGRGRTSTNAGRRR